MAPRESRIEYSLSPYQCEPTVKFSVNEVSKLAGAVSIEAGDPRQEAGSSGEVTYIFPVKITLTSKLLPRSGEAVVVARSPIGEQAIPVRWKVVDEFLTSPENTVLLFEETPEESTYQCVIRHWEGKPFRVVRAESSNDAVTLLPVTDEGTAACVRLRRNASVDDARSGTVSVRIKLESTEVRELEIPWKIVRLQSAAE